MDFELLVSRILRRFFQDDISAEEAMLEIGNAYTELARRSVKRHEAKEEAI